MLHFDLRSFVYARPDVETTPHVETVRNGAELLLADASNGWAAPGACSVAGIGLRDIGFRSWSNWAAIDPKETGYSLPQNSSSR
jgi:hypothetical protein